MARIAPILFLLVAVLWLPAARAQTAQPIFHCIGAQGEPVFSGEPCGTPAPANDAGAATAMPAGTVSVCAASPQALRQDIAAAFATRDVNRLAGLILWRGMHQGSAQATLGALATWLRQPLAGVTFDSGADPAAGASAEPPPSATAAPPTSLTIATGGGAGNHRTFGLVETGGCWWLTF